jgi:Leucine-rich repeat (LRR) protein
MKFKSLLRKLLVEDTKLSKFRTLYNRVVLPSEKALEKNPNAKGAIDLDLFKQFILADPTSIVPVNFDIENATDKDMELVKVGSYTDWILRHYLIPNLPDEIKTLDPKLSPYKEAVQNYKGRYLEDLSKTTERLKFHNDNKQYLPIDKRDHNKLSPEEIKDIFINFKLPEKVQKKKEKSLARKTREGFKHAGSDVVYEDGEWIILQISKDKGVAGKDAAIYYGGFKDVRNGESDWCTASPNLSFYETYIAQGPLFVVFPQDDKGQVGNRTGLPFERYQFHFESNQFMDRKDHRLDDGDVVGFFNNRPVLKEFFKPYFIKSSGRQGKTQDPNQFEFIYSKNNRDLAGIAVVLYGMDDLINNIPLTVSKIMIKSDTPIVINLPKDFGDKYQNLKSLVLKSCIDKLPDSIGNLKKLITLTISNNPGLKELPSTLINLRDTLDFINIQGSEQVKIPDNLKEIIQDQGKGFLYIN